MTCRSCAEKRRRREQATKAFSTNITEFIERIKKERERSQNNGQKKG